jgi:hypothetical protein
MHIITLTFHSTLALLLKHYMHTPVCCIALKPMQIAEDQTKQVVCYFNVVEIETNVSYFDHALQFNESHALQ